MILRRVVFALFLVAAISSSGLAQKLGTIRFPNSGAATAQGPFIRGVLLLHSFEYADAAASFREAQRVDPGFALAYWGEAMTYTHPVWNEQDAGAARAVLTRLGATPAERRQKAPTHREQMYLDAVEALYGPGSKERRDTLFADAMDRLVRAHPDDDEARAFHALGLLGLSQAVRNVPTYMRAGAIAQELMQRNPDHPGAAHYAIHAFDDPVHAPLGLPAARAYSTIAPAAPHAQHMTTHIFVAMGMWDDVVSQNEIASGHDHGAWRAGHYTAWLEYGYLQQGRLADARAHLEKVRANVSTPLRRGESPSLLSMRAHYVINSERWNDPALGWTLPTANIGPVAQAMDAFTIGYAALKAGRRAEAEAQVATLATLSSAARMNDAFGGSPSVPVVLEKELRAMLKARDGDVAGAIALLGEAAKQEDAIPSEYGPPDIVKPTHELLGEILLAANRPADAVSEFRRALELAPGRSRALLGLARAAAAAGDRAMTQRALGDLRRNWHRADRDLPELAELEKLLAKGS
jgi:tetratricopeptide (TPR) repeat protein